MFVAIKNNWTTLFKWEVAELGKSVLSQENSEVNLLGFAERAMNTSKLNIPKFSKCLLKVFRKLLNICGKA